MRLALGTVQFGVDYGVTNTQGRVDSENVRQIIDYAKTAGIELLDTAALYGDSETVLGQLAACDRFRIVTKTDLTVTPRQTVKASLLRSLDRLRCEQVYGLLLHRGQELIGPEGDQIYAELQQLKSSGRVQKVGVSVYCPKEADILASRYSLDLVQLPYSVLDQRFFRCGCVERLKARGVEVHARSLFLQGVLLANPKDLPRKLSRHQQALEAYHHRREAAGLDPLAYALGICHSSHLVDRFIVGCCSRLELQQIVDAYHRAREQVTDYEGIHCDDETLLIPSYWS